MGNAMTFITDFFTTTLSILASIAITYWTFSRQDHTEYRRSTQLRKIHQETSLELFRAAIASLLFCVPKGNPSFSRSSLQICIQKLNVIESQLSELDHSLLPDSYIKSFRYYRLQLSFMRLDLQQISDSCEETFSDRIFDELEIMDLINRLHSFIKEYSA